jgi:hypothetical protein
MGELDRKFEEFRYDFIAHLAARFDLTAEVVTHHLGTWLLDREHQDDEWRSVAIRVHHPLPNA